jgi:DNA-directed RNA polymerase subunit H (RpoH/RPB5)
MTPPSRPRARRPLSKAAKAKAEAAAEPPRPFIAHHLVPPHELLTEAEGAAALKELGTLAERLPKILVTDQGLRTDAKYLAAREAHEPLAGRLVRVRRPSATAGEAIAYRVIIDHLGE